MKEHNAQALEIAFCHFRKRISNGSQSHAFGVFVLIRIPCKHRPTLHIIRFPSIANGEELQIFLIDVESPSRCFQRSLNFGKIVLDFQVHVIRSLDV